ncbi:LpqB family beta-propeller domain-containing protein [Leifsonia sp. YAF41]|uniref:LpqB family beta-propeller domain-containing protein n=1 Tax=Leifsonia sp. YAF41 TaxID=3233086 RepID=UPI003F9E7B53
MSDAPRRSRLRAWGALAVLAVTLLAGCSGIPRSGEVQAGAAAPPGDTLNPVFLPSGPEKNASQESILRGFIDAASSPENNYAIARKFLAPADSTSWAPDAGVTVDDGSGRVIQVVDDMAMQFSVKPVAEVNEKGEYREVGSSAPVTLLYHFVLVEGQWRISQPPNGIVIDQNTFRDVFSSQEIYFYDPTFTYLVPDLRWFPRGASAPTKIVNAVLAGPSPWLAPAVTTAFPEGTKLTADAVQVVARVAQVDLNNEALNAERVTLQRMKAQLTNSLPSGLSVTITINHNSQDIGDLGDAAPIVNPRGDARALILRNDEFGFLGATGSSLTPVSGLSDSIATLKPKAVTLAAGQDFATALADGGVYGIPAGAPARLLDPRANLIAPSVDPFNMVWSVPADRPAELFAYTPSGESVAVPTNWQDATSITSLVVSRDGSRLIALLSTGADVRFVVAAISRDKGIPVALGEPVTLAAAPGTPLGATWIDDVTVASLTVTPTGTEQIVAQEIGGVRTPLEPAPHSVSITGGNTLRDLRALSVDQGLQVQWGSGWQQRIDHVALIATQQGLL